MVEEILEWNRFARNSIRRCAIQVLYERLWLVNPSSKDPQFQDFRNHPSAPSPQCLRFPYFSRYENLSQAFLATSGVGMFTFGNLSRHAKGRQASMIALELV